MVASSSPDIVERLKPIANYVGLYKPHCQTILEAAAEIERLRAQAARAPDREAVSKVVKHLLYNDDRERDYPVYRTQDDNGLEQSQYVDFAMDVLAALTPDVAQPPAEPGMQAAVQYRRKDGGYGPGWITMAMFDGTLAAEAYCSQQRTDDKWPFEYRAVELTACSVSSTEGK
jgi:ABC-type branched-subunit amino acid transport system substrate-binding protein